MSTKDSRKNRRLQKRQRNFAKTWSRHIGKSLRRFYLTRKWRLKEWLEE